MKIIQRARAALVKQLGGADGGGISASIHENRGTPPKRTMINFLDAYGERPWLSAFVDRVATSVSEIEWKLFAAPTSPEERRRTGRSYKQLPLVSNAGPTRRPELIKALVGTGDLVEIETHPLLDLLAGPNSWHVGNQTLKLVQQMLELVGEGPLIMERNGARMPTQLWSVPPNWIRELPTPKRPTFRIDMPGFRGEMASRDVLWLAMPSPRHPYGRGLGLAASIADELDIDEYAAKHIKATFWNRARPDILIMAEHDDLADPVTKARLEAEWLAKHQGFMRSSRPAFLNFVATIKELGQSFESLQIKDLRPQQRDAIRHRFGFPPEIFGVLESANRSTIDVADLIYNKFGVRPRMELMRAFMQQRLVPEFDERLILDFVSTVPEDKEHQLAVMKAAPHNFMLDQWQVAAGNQPLPDGKGQVFMMPVGVIPVAAPLEEAQAAGIEARVRRSVEQLPPADRQLLLQAGEAKGNFTDDDPDDLFFLAVHRIADRLEPQVRKRFLEAVTAMRGAIGEAELQALLQALRAGQAAVAAAGLPWAEFQRVFDGTTVSGARSLEALFLAGLAGTGEIAAGELNAALSASVVFDVGNPRVVAFARQHTAKLVREVTERSREAIREMIARQLEALGTSAPSKELAELVRDRIGLTSSQQRTLERFTANLADQGVDGAAAVKRTTRFRDGLIRRRAMAISRTETIRAANGGQRMLWRQARDEGVLPADRARVRWIVTPDDRLDAEVCEPMPFLAENEDVGLDGVFTLGDFSGTVSDPPAHTLCRCSTSLVILARGKDYEVQFTLDKMARVVSRLAQVHRMQPDEEPIAA